MPQFSDISINEPHFSAEFDRRKKVLKALWKWMSEQPPVDLKNKMPQYAVPDIWWIWDEAPVMAG